MNSLMIVLIRHWENIIIVVIKGRMGLGMIRSHCINGAVWMAAGWLHPMEKNVFRTNRGNHTKDAFRNVYCCLVHQQRFYRPFRLSFSLRLFEVAEYCGMAVNYVTSRCYDAIAIKGEFFLCTTDKKKLFRYWLLLVLIFRFENVSNPFGMGPRIGRLFKRCTDVFLSASSCFRQPDGLCCQKCLPFRKIEVVMTDEQAALQQECELEEEVCLRAKRSEYPPLVCIHRIDLKISAVADSCGLRW